MLVGEILLKAILSGFCTGSIPNMTNPYLMHFWSDLISKTSPHPHKRRGGKPLSQLVQFLGNRGGLKKIYCCVLWEASLNPFSRIKGFVLVQKQASFKKKMCVISGGLTRICQLSARVRNVLSWRPVLFVSLRTRQGVVVGFDMSIRQN